MSRIYLLLFLVLILGSSCNRQGKQRSERYTPAAVTGATTSDTGFVTPRDEPARTSGRDVSAASAPRENIAPVRFLETETQHVRIVHYDPFDGKDALEIDLDELGRYFTYPYPGHKTSEYGMRGRSMHTGVDIKVPANDTIRTVLGGVVRMSKSYADYGNTVVVRHPCGLETVYSHNTKNLVRPNDIVQAGDPIGLAGRTGRATGDHLHFEVRIMGEHFDPNLLLDTDNKCIRTGKIYLTKENGRIFASNSLRRNYVEQPEPVVLAAATPATSTSQAVYGGSNSVSSNASIHEVRSGDTLFSISRKYGVSVDALCSLNGISREGVLSIGQQIKLQ